MTKTLWKGGLAAFAAAAFNGSAGILSKVLMDSGMTASSIAFYKSVCALVIVSLLLVATGQAQALVGYLRQHAWALFVASFLGVFILYVFETTAFAYEKVSIVAFVLLGSSTLATFALLSILERRLPSWGQSISIGLALIGLGLMFLESLQGLSLKGCLFASVGGIGYGCFLVLVRKFSLGSGLKTIWGLLFFASMLLAIPAAREGFSVVSTYAQGSSLLLSAVIPTILGFWCTTKALDLIDSSKVQLIELTEPIFATIFAALLFQEGLTQRVMMGGFFIILSIVSFEKLDALLGASRRLEVAPKS